VLAVALAAAAARAGIDIRAWQSPLEAER